MKQYKYIFTLLIAFAILFNGCKDADIEKEHHFDNSLYVTTKAVTDDLLIKPEITSASREITYRIAQPASNDVVIEFEANPSLNAAYNLIYSDNAFALGEEYYSLSVNKTTIKKGDVSSENIIINFHNTDKLNNTKRYVLPITITNASNINVLDSKRTVYFVFKGAALINVVADISKMYFPINWTSNVEEMSIITVEALVRSSDWVAGRDNALSSIFGIEGVFLVRVGDGDRPRDQVQVVAPGGNFPGPNAVAGLPVNEWVHIAVVYNSITKERLLYKDGILVYGDESANSPISLTSSCYIGRSWDDSRWLPGEISEVRIWNIARSAAEIAENSYGINPKTEGLVSYWKFNEGAGSDIKDYTENGNNISAKGGVTSWVNVELHAIK